MGEQGVVSYVESRLNYLHQLKKHRLERYWKFREEYSQNSGIGLSKDNVMLYEMNTGFSIVRGKTAEITSTTPKFDFVGLDEKGRKYKKMVEKLWSWVWLVSGTDGAIQRIVEDAMKYGSGFGVETWVNDKRTVNVPSIVGDSVVFNEKEFTEYSGCKLIPISFENIYINGSEYDNCTEAIILSYYDRDEFLGKFSNSNLYSFDENEIKGGRMYGVYSGHSDLIHTTSRSSNYIDQESTVSVMEYYNKYKDQYIVIAGGVHINKNTKFENGIGPIPHPHKDIPIVVYTDYKVDGDVYGRGEFDITYKSRALKDEARSYRMEIVKLLGGLITVSPDSDFDEVVERFGLRQIARVEKDDLSFFQPQVSTNPIESLENKIDEDIIIETGYDFKSQLLSPNETAERTKGKISAMKSRINLNIRENAYSFYSRLAMLRLRNIAVFYKGAGVTIPIDGFDIDENGVQTRLTGDYGIMKVIDDMLDGEILLIPKIDSMTGDSSKEQKDRYLEMFQLLINLRGSDGKQIVDVPSLLEAGKGIIDSDIDLDRVLAGAGGGMVEIESRLKARGLAPFSEQEVGGIPPAQQSGRALLLPSRAND